MEQNCKIEQNILFRIMQSMIKILKGKDINLHFLKIISLLERAKNVS